MADEIPSRLGAISVARADRERTLDLVSTVASAAMTATGLGGGAWSPKDLLGHLESWEQHALDALDAWTSGVAAPIGAQLEQLGTDEVNRREIDRKAGWSLEQVVGSAAATHASLLGRFEALGDERWMSPPLPGEDFTVGGRLGSILGGGLGGFRHDPDHWTDLEAFALSHPA
jgi:hypothetical protein